MAMAMCNRLSKCQAHRHDANGLCHMNVMKLNFSHTHREGDLKL